MKKTQSHSKNRSLTTIKAVAGVLAVILALAIGYLVWTIHERSTNIQAIVAQETEPWTAYTKSVDAIKKPDGLDDAVFEKLKQKALAAYDRSRLDLAKAAEEDNDKYSKLVSAKAPDQTRAEQYLAVLEKADQIPVSALNRLADNEDLLPSLAEFDASKTDEAYEGNLDTSLDTVPDLKTFDPRWANIPYGNGLISFDGEVPVALSEIFAYLNQDPGITPWSIAQFAKEYGYDLNPVMDPGNTLFSAAGIAFGVNLTPIAHYKTQVNQSLDGGGVVLARIGDENNSHYVVISDRNAEGQWLVNTPTSQSEPQWVDMDEMKTSLLDCYSYWVPQYN